MKIKKNKGMGKRRRSNSMKREENTLQREREREIIQFNLKLNYLSRRLERERCETGGFMEVR